MRLTPEEVTRIVNRIISEWRNSKLAAVHGTDEAIRVELTETFLKELRVEDDLNKEVEQMLSKYDKEFQSGKLDRRKMFTMFKNQLAKERKVIL